MGAAGAALPIIGNALQAWAAFREQAAMNAQVNNEVGDQAGFQRQAQGVVDASITNSGRKVTDKQVAAGTNQAKQDYARVAQSGEGTQRNAIIGESSPGANQAWASLTGALRAPMQGYNEFTLQQMIKNLRASQQLGVISQLAKGRASLLPLELKNAQNSWQTLSTWGKIISSAGGAMGATAPDSGSMQY